LIDNLWFGERTRSPEICRVDLGDASEFTWRNDVID
jgi:hypothetical protein